MNRSSMVEETYLIRIGFARVPKPMGSYIVTPDSHPSYTELTSQERHLKQLG